MMDLNKKRKIKLFKNDFNKYDLIVERVHQDCIDRCFVKKKKILVIDEAISRKKIRKCYIKKKKIKKNQKRLQLEVQV